jgi:hypothetical protein
MYPPAFVIKVAKTFIIQFEPYVHMLGSVHVRLMPSDSTAVANFELYGESTPPHPTTG